jgi:hypothetical protein
MKNIKFSYEILFVDNDAKSMEVLYTSEGRLPVHVGVRIPYLDEKLDDVIISFAPFAYWESQEKLIQNVEIGLKGTLELNLEPETKNELSNYEDLTFFENVSGNISVEEIKEE